MSFDLNNAHLRIPALQSDPFPVAQVKPSPCILACPAGVNVKAYVSQIAEGRFGDALETVRRRCPLPGICGRICHHPCEKACRRARYDDALSIRALKRFVADHERELPMPAPVPLTHGQKIGIIGSGPAGLTAAYDLRLAGYPVTIFEAAEKTGGMLRYGVADYRLPPEVLDFEIEVIRSTGVEIVTNKRIGSADALRAQGYAAVLVAVGAQSGNKLGIEGAVEDALSFLRRAKEGGRMKLSGRVVVVGGGSTAVEAARTALRLGGEPVEVFYRRYREELLADEEEVEAAEAEGVRFRFLVAPKRRFKRGLQCVQIGLGMPDASGRRRPIEIPGSEFMVDCDLVLAAVGQSVDWPSPIEEVTETPGVFAAGDAVTGPATVIEAIAGGHHAADAIRSYLEQTPLREWKPERKAPLEFELPEVEPLRATRIRPEMLKPADDDKFSEVECVFSDADAMAEAQRCLRCGPCGECRICATTCNRRHLMLRTEEGEAFLVRAPSNVALALNVERALPGTLLSRGNDRSAVEVLPVRSRLTPEKCRACGRCVDVCPFHALSLNGTDTARLEASLCRGCGLCAAVCPTTAAMQSALSPEWWSDRLDHVLAPSVVPNSTLVLACQRRAGSIEGANVIRFRCVGQLDAGMLLELAHQPFKHILVAGCTTARCRFTNGATRAIEQLARANKIVTAIGIDASRIVADWSPDRAGDRLEPAIARVTGGH